MRRRQRRGSGRSAVSGRAVLTTVTPRTLDRNAWVYGTRTNVQLGSARAGARRKLAELGSSLRSLRDQSQTRAERVRVLRSVIAATQEQARAFAEVERGLTHSSQ